MDENTRRQSPIFTKTTAFIFWLLQHTEKYPKSERFRLARRLEDTAFEMYELMMQAARSTQKRRYLYQVDLQLEKLRFYLRVAQARRLATPNQYFYAAEAVSEIGRLLGGWLKSLPE